MRITWKDLELPSRVERDREVSTDSYGRFYIEPFERGFGTTIGNSLRRVLLSSLEGSAVTSIKIAGVSHEFASIPGVLEDATEIVLNVKNIIVRLQGNGPRVMKVTANKTGEVKAGDIVADPFVQIVNKDLVLVTLTQDVKFEMEMTVENGRGYSPASDKFIEAERFDQEIGLIFVDAIYSPVKRVRYKTEDTRVGQRTNYDKLILEVWTNGTVSPEMALVEAAKILRKHINPFVQYFELGRETVQQELVIEQIEEPKVDQALAEKFKMPIQDMELSVRASNCLESQKIETVGQLVSMPESELLKVRSFGKTSLREVKRKLAEMGLSLGMSDVKV